MLSVALFGWCAAAEAGRRVQRQESGDQGPAAYQSKLSPNPQDSKRANLANQEKN